MTTSSIQLVDRLARPQRRLSRVIEHAEVAEQLGIRHAAAHRHRQHHLRLQLIISQTQSTIAVYRLSTHAAIVPCMRASEWMHVLGAWHCRQAAVSARHSDCIRHATSSCGSATSTRVAHVRMHACAQHVRRRSWDTHTHRHTRMHAGTYACMHACRHARAQKIAQSVAQ